MIRQRGGDAVKGGFYWNRSSWKVEVVKGAAGVLPGDHEARYLRVPVLLMIPLALVLSVLFVLFLPLIGFAVLGETLFVHARKSVARSLGRTVAVRPSTIRRG